MHKPMTPEAQRIAIAEACGWKPDTEKTVPYRKIWWVPGTWEGDYDTEQDLPDYLNDLNAMHLAEKTLANEQQDEYNRQLEQIHKRSRVLWKDVTGFVTVHSTAEQRAEAFLKTLGLWTATDP